MDEPITAKEKLDLKRLMDNFTDYQDNTEYIRRVKHSSRIAQDINSLNDLKASRGNMDADIFMEKALERCPFIAANYNDVFIRVVKDEMDLAIMAKLLHVLNLIETGSVDQQDGSVLVGKLLKTLYLDSAVKVADNLNKIHDVESNTPIVENGKSISWRQYKTDIKLKLNPVY
jgi:hypothetical protein